jgi:hypothetical protein
VDQLRDPVARSAHPLPLRWLRRCFDEHAQLQLDAVWVPEDEYRPVPDVRDPRVVNTQAVKMLDPSFEIISGWDSKSKMVQARPELREPASLTAFMLDHADDQASDGSTMLMMRPGNISAETVS